MKHEDIKTKLDALGEAYKASDSVAEREALASQIREATIELQDALCKGANPCPDGEDHRVVGMLKRPAYYDGRLEMDIPVQWETGCIICPPVLILFDESVHRVGANHPTSVDKKGDPVKVVRWSHSARGVTPKEAVENWNAEKWVTDTKIDSVPSQDIVKP